MAVDVAKKPKILRPMPPEFEGWHTYFIPAPEMVDWVRGNFLVDGGHLYNPDHIHLLDANLCFLWARDGITRQGNAVVGQAEIPRFQGNKWQKTRQEQQINEWFGVEPDFLITLCAPYAETVDDATFCALVEHELYHCAQQTNEFGERQFNRDTGRPKYMIQGHDVEEFVGVVRRYGAGHSAGKTMQLVHAALQDPEIAPTSIGRACGTCLKLAA